MKNLKVLVPANLSFSSGVRDFVKEMASLAEFEDRQTNMLRLVVDELFMNAIRYGSDNDSHVFLEGIVDGNKVIFAVEDEGKGQKKIKAQDLQNIINEQKENTSLKKEHGRGLAQITSTLVQAFEVTDKEDGGLRIEFLMEKQNLPSSNKNQVNEKNRSDQIMPEKEFAFSGEIDLNNLDEISEEIQEFLNKNQNMALRLIFDFSKLYYCNSTFLGKLAYFHTLVSDNDGETIIKNPSKEILEILDLVGLTHLFIIENK
jgi:anti-anti-sigma factor